IWPNLNQLFTDFSRAYVCCWQLTTWVFRICLQTTQPNADDKYVAIDKYMVLITCIICQVFLENSQRLLHGWLAKFVEGHDEHIGCTGFVIDTSSIFSTILMPAFMDLSLTILDFATLISRLMK
ncbi:hypothetical protein ACJX0J_029157, partial [Zea mays]